MATKRSTPTPVAGLAKAPNAGRHPAAPAAQQPYDVPIPGTTNTTPVEHEPRRSFDEPTPPVPLAQFNSKIEPALLHRFRRVAKRRDVSIQQATTEAMVAWLDKNDR